MRSAVLREFGKPLSLEERPCPEQSKDEVLVRVRGCGVCHTDLHISAGHYPKLPLPRVLGHEIAGEVKGIGDVLVYACWGCGHCELCRRGDEQLCLQAAEAGWICDGGYAEYVRVPSKRYLLPLDGLDPVRAAPLADAGVTAYRSVKRAHPWIEDGSCALVIGAGGLGQFAIQFLRLLTKADVIAVDPDQAKCKQALKLGASKAQSITENLPPAQAILDFVGTDETLAFAAQNVVRGGIVVQIGEAEGRVRFGFGCVPYEATFTTSIWGSLEDLKVVLKFAQRGDIQWIVEPVPLENVNDAFDRLRRGDVAGRLVIIP